MNSGFEVPIIIITLHLYVTIPRAIFIPYRQNDNLSHGVVCSWKCLISIA